MGDRLSFSLPGSMETWEGTDQSIGLLGIAGAVTRLVMQVSDAASGDDFTCDLRDATGGGGNGITFTIPDGTKVGTVVTTQLAVAADEVLYLRVTEAAGALNLRGWFEFEPTGTSAVSASLTTLAIVKNDEGISAATWDTQLNRIISGVSKAMQNWMRRSIVDTSITDEVHSGNGWCNYLVLEHRPITTTDTMVVELDDVEVTSSLYTQNVDAGIIYLTDAYWTAGVNNYKVTYSAGYTATPADLVMAATSQCRHEWHQSQPAGANRLGLTGTVHPSGESATYLPGGFLPEVIEVMRPNRRIV